jgi:hypothetical protein
MFLKIATQDLMTKQVAQTAVTDTETASIVEQGEAAEATAGELGGLGAATGAEGLAGAAGAAAPELEAVGAGIVAAGAGAVAAGGSTGIFAGIIAAATGPVALAALGIAAWGVSLYEAYQHIPDFHNAVNTMVDSFVTLGKEVKTAFWGTDYAKDVETATNKSVANVILMSNHVLTKLNELKISGGAISKDTADAVTAASTTMYDDVAKKADERCKQETDDAELLKDNLKGFSTTTYNDMLATATKQKTDSVAQAKEMNDKVQAEVVAMQKAGVNVTEDMKNKMIQDFKDMTRETAVALSDGEKQQKATLDLLKADHGTVSKEIAQQTLKDAVDAKNGATKSEDDKYKQIIETITNNRDVLRTMTSAQAQDAIDAAKDQHKKTVDQINGTYEDTVEILKTERPNLVTEMSTTTGQMLTPWQTFEVSVSNIFSNLGSTVSNFVMSAENAVKSILGMASTAAPNNSGGMQAARHATGTNFFEGGATWVGEEGPELVELPQGTKITPHQTSMSQMVNMGGSGRPGNNTQTNTINININGMGKSGPQLGQDIAKEIRLQMAMVTS